MKTLFCFTVCLCTFTHAYCWGFFGHAQINHYAVYLLPTDMIVLFKPAQTFLEEHAADPDKRRYAVPEEGPRHYIDIDHYGAYPFPLLPHEWEKAVATYTEDSLKAHGIVPWHVQVMLARLTRSFRDLNYAEIMKNSAELGHYIADAHVPLHASSNHNGQLTQQQGIHGFWESRIPELLAASDFDFVVGKAVYLDDPGSFIWDRVLESAHATDSVLSFEKALNDSFPAASKYAFEERNGKTVKQYSSAYTLAYNQKLQGMVERRMRQSIFAVASFWYTAWVDAGQPDLRKLKEKNFSADEMSTFDWLNQLWQKGTGMLGRGEE